ncbi:MAG: hypothetical protein RR358_05930 [Cetobacterium sp.]
MEKATIMSMIDIDRVKGIVDYYTNGVYNTTSRMQFVKELLEQHSKEKQHIFELFGEKLRIEEDIETVVGDSEARTIRRSLLEALTGKKLYFVRQILRALPLKNFKENTLDRDYFILDVKLDKGMKLSKALTKLCLVEDAHKVSTEHSMAIQKLKTKGRVVLSIDPVDYLTMSCNSSGWKSCHRINGGEYAAGPISYLGDSSTVICFIESSTPCTFNYNGNSYSHSNKIWRQIALVSKDCSYSIQERQYPATSSINEQAVSKLLIEQFNKINQETNFKTENMHVGELGKLHIDYSAISDNYSLHYNDITSDMFSSGAVIHNKTEFNFMPKTVNKPVKGSAVKCLCCGDAVYDSESIYCGDCDNMEYDD